MTAEAPEEDYDDVVQKSVALGGDLSIAICKMINENNDGRVVQAGAIQYAAGRVLFALGYPLRENESVSVELPALFVGYVNAYELAEVRGLLRAPAIVRNDKCN